MPPSGRGDSGDSSGDVVMMMMMMMKYLVADELG